MNTQSSILLYLLYTMITGTIAYVFFFMICQLNKDTKALKTRYAIIKTVVLAFIVPVCFILELYMSYDNGIWISAPFFTTPMLHKISMTILLVWAVGSFLKLCIWRYQSKIFRYSIKLYTETQKFDQVLTETRKKIGIRKKVHVLIGEYYESPFCTGVCKAKICIPDHDFSKEELEHIFLHELVHHKHKDLWFLLMIHILEIVYWFHPIFLKKKLLLQYRELMEDACDIEVCSQINDYKSYIRVLLQIVLQNTGQQYNLPVFLSEGFEDIMRRIKNMELYRTQKKMKRCLVAVGMIAIFCGSSIVVYAADRVVTKGYESVYMLTWEGEEEEINGNTENTLEEVYELAQEEEGVIVEYIDDEAEPYSTLYYVNYDLTVGKEIRKITSHMLNAGEEVLVALSVDPEDGNIKVGFYMSDGHVRYITGSGDIYHTFTIYDDCAYSFFVQNQSSKPVKVDGYYRMR